MALGELFGIDGPKIPSGYATGSRCYLLVSFQFAEDATKGAFEHCTT